jgi:hypothetical protein
MKGILWLATALYVELVDGQGHFLAIQITMPFSLPLGLQTGFN